MVDAWNAAEISAQDVALPPCHNFFQFYVAEGKLSLQMYQRSCDMFLGVPLNIASYSVLLHMVAKITGLIPHEFIHVLGDAHIYLNHLDAVKEQLSRKPYPLPKLRIADRGQTEIDHFEMDDFELINYQHHDNHPRGNGGLKQVRGRATIILFYRVLHGSSATRYTQCRPK